MTSIKGSKQIRKGFFITFEGPEGSGKTTQIRLLKEFLSANSKTEVITTREPGGTNFGDSIRGLLLNHREDHLEAETELFLMLAQRTEHLRKVIYPALNENKIVLCDRYFDSTMAYQGYGRGLSPSLLAETHSKFLGNFIPDITFFLDINPEEGLKRASHGGAKELDRMESEAISFHKKVYNGYLEMAANNSERFKVIDSSGIPLEISSKIREHIVGCCSWIKFL